MLLKTCKYISYSLVLTWFSFTVCASQLRHTVAFLSLFDYLSRPTLQSFSSPFLLLSATILVTLFLLTVSLLSHNFYFLLRYHHCYSLFMSLFNN